jgi:hypothetical protein
MWQPSVFKHQPDMRCFNTRTASATCSNHWLEPCWCSPTHCLPRHSYPASQPHVKPARGAPLFWQDSAFAFSMLPQGLSAHPFTSARQAMRDEYTVWDRDAGIVKRQVHKPTDVRHRDSSTSLGSPRVRPSAAATRLQGRARGNVPTVQLWLL